MRDLLLGKIVHGDKLGRTLGFPTANLELFQDFASNISARKLPAGVFTCVCIVPDFQIAEENTATDQVNLLRREVLPSIQEVSEVREYFQTNLAADLGLADANYHRIFAGLLHFGPRATLGESERKCEVFLYNFNAEIYGLTMAVFVRDLLRPSEKFTGLESLVAQMKVDKQQGQEKLYLA